MLRYLKEEDSSVGNKLVYLSCQILPFKWTAGDK